MERGTKVLATQDNELVRQTLRGDKRAFGVLIQRHQDGVFALVSRLIRNQGEVQDVAQDAFVRAYKALPTFRGDAQFGTWLYRIVWNTCLDRREQHARIQEREIRVRTDDENAGIDGFADEETPLADELFESADVRTRLDECLKRLPAHYRAVLTLFYYEQKSYDEIAEIRNQPMNTIKVHIFRAKSHLKKALLAERPSEEWAV